MKNNKTVSKRPKPGQPKKDPTGTISYRVPLPVTEAWKELSKEDKRLLREVLIEWINNN